MTVTFELVCYSRMGTPADAMPADAIEALAWVGRRLRWEFPRLRITLESTHHEALGLVFHLRRLWFGGAGLRLAGAGASAGGGCQRRPKGRQGKRGVGRARAGAGAGKQAWSSPVALAGRAGGGSAQLGETPDEHDRGPGEQARQHQGLITIIPGWAQNLGTWLCVELAAPAPRKAAPRP